jgi:hypothetical protein
MLLDQLPDPGTSQGRSSSCCICSHAWLRLKAVRCCLGAVGQAHSKVQALVLCWEDFVGLEAPLQRPVVPAKSRQQRASSMEQVSSRIQMRLCIGRRSPVQLHDLENKYYSQQTRQVVYPAQLLHDQD